MRCDHYDYWEFVLYTLMSRLDIFLNFLLRINKRYISNMLWMIPSGKIVRDDVEVKDVINLIQFEYM